MKLGLDSYSYHLTFGAHPDFTPERKMDLFQFIERVAELGLDGFQIDPMHLENKTTEYLNEILALTREKNLFLEYGAMGIEADYLGDELEICAQLESPVLRTFIGFDRYHKNTNIKDEIEGAIYHLKKVKPRAEALGIKIAIENHGDVNSLELLEIIQRVDSGNIGVCLDLGNSLVTFEDPLRVVERLAPHTFTTHFKDYAIRMTNFGFKVIGVALGEGNIDLFSALKILKEKTSLDKIILEIPVEAEAEESETLKKEDSIIRQSVDFARNVLKVV